MSDNDNNDLDAVERVRVAVAERALAAPDGEEDDRRAFAPVPGGHGFVPIVGRPDRPRAEWVLEGTRVTVAELGAAAAVLSAEGLGSRAILGWGGLTFDVAVTSWGATAERAVLGLIDGLRSAGPDVREAVADVSLDDPWTPGEQRHDPTTGILIGAPALGQTAAVRVLRVRRARIVLEVVVTDPAEWVFGLRAAAAVDPLPPAASFNWAHTCAYRRVRFDWRGSERSSAGAGRVAPVVPATATRG